MKQKEAARQNSQTHEILEPHCGVLVDLCTLRLWRPLPASRFEPLGAADVRLVRAEVARLLGLERPREPHELLSFGDTAARAGYARKTLYEWKRTGKLRREHGLRVIGRSPRIDWSVFKSCIEKGGLS